VTLVFAKDSIRGFETEARGLLLLVRTPLSLKLANFAASKTNNFRSRSILLIEQVSY